MRRRNRLNALLLAAALALGLAAWLLPSDEPGTGPLTGLAPGDVDGIEIEFRRDDAPDAPSGEGAGPELALERRRDGWHLTRPIERPARDGRIVTALGVLAARTRSCYALDERDPDEFGLARPRLILRAGGVAIAFGDRAADGRRYVRTGDRLCLVRDRSFPLLARGLDGLAAPALLRDGVVPLRIETPRASAARDNGASAWSLAGHDRYPQADIEAWAARWRAARARSFLPEAPAADHGHVRIEAGDGSSHQWRIAREPPELVLVPAGAAYGVAVSGGDALLSPRSAPTPARGEPGRAEDTAG